MQSSCSTSKYLENSKLLAEGEYLLYKQEIKGQKEVPKEKYTSLYQQKPNRKIPLIGSRPYFYFYFLGKSFQYKKRIEKKRAKIIQKYNKKLAVDSSNKKRIERLRTEKEKKLNKLDVRENEGNAFMRTFGEAPSIADAEKFTRTTQLMQQMLGAKGFFHNQVYTKFDTTRKKLRVTYQVKENNPHLVSSFVYQISNKKIFELINKEKEHSFIKINQKLDESTLIQERDRIDKFLKDQGYYDFQKQFISYRIDTTVEAYHADVKMIINADSGSTIFKKYTIGSISCLLEYNEFGKRKLDTVWYDNIQFVQAKNKYGKKVIAGKIKLRPNDPYSLSKTINTQLNLANLDNFRYIDIRFLKSRIIDTTLHMVIVLNSSKKYQITDEWGMNVTQGLPGPQGSIAFLHRNVLRGCENIDASIRYGIEGVASATDPDVVYKTAEGSADLGITFPQFYIPTRIRFKFNNLYPRTRVSFSLNNIVRPEYSRRNLKLAVNYTFTRNTYSRYILSVADLNIIQTPQLKSSFSDYLALLQAQGNTLVTSFRPSFVSSIHFTYLYNNNDFTRFVNGSFVRLFAESGGTTLRFFQNELDKAEIIQNKRLFGELDYYKYLKFNSDFRLYRSPTPKNQFAFRLNTGVAISSSENKALPYEKYFFAGGSNSLRAWRPRRLGPGSLAPVNIRPDGSFDYKFEQPGEIVFETSVESRFKVIKFIEGAFFLDAGNVWRLGTSLQTNEKPQFSLDRFYKEIAIGTGIGLRLNFTFLLVRFDWGMKVYDPAYPLQERLVIKDWSFDNITNNKEYGLLNIGIGYPF